MAVDQASATTTGTALDAVNRELVARDLLPGWSERPGGPSMWAEPRPALEYASWSYAEATDLLRRSAPLLTPEQTERRNAILVNPSPASTYATVRTQVLAYQMIMPGERARTHRHSPHAGRLVLDVDSGAYTVVNGMRIPMGNGDVVLTPGWHWHGHGHEGEQPGFWLDFLDVPLVQLLDPMFFEPYPGDWQPPSPDAGDPSSLVFPWADTVDRLDAAPDDEAGARRIELGSPALPTIGLYMQRLAAGGASLRQRATAHRQFCVVEGAGSTEVGGVSVPWSRGDVVVVPGWTPYRHHSPGGATLFEMSDEPLQRYCGYLQTETMEDL